MSRGTKTWFSWFTEFITLNLKICDIRNVYGFIRFTGFFSTDSHTEEKPDPDPVLRNTGISSDPTRLIPLSPVHQHKAEAEPSWRTRWEVRHRWGTGEAPSFPLCLQGVPVTMRRSPSSRRSGECAAENKTLRSSLAETAEHQSSSAPCWPGPGQTEQLRGNLLKHMGHVGTPPLYIYSW